MNPPFTKVERGIRNFVNMNKFYDRCGGEVGLWGHFVALADVFLEKGGTFGAVIPINVLRGRESEKVRHILFEEWTPLYILKSTYNYGFSEWAEYRDVLFIARKQRAEPNHKVKFCLIKKCLTQLTEDDIIYLVQKIQRENHFRSKKLDIDSHSLSNIKTRFTNLMWFCGGTDFRHRDILIKFMNKFAGIFSSFPHNYFREGYRPVPKGVSKFLFITRHTNDSRIQQAFLRFQKESVSTIKATSPLGVSYEIECEALKPTLRTPVGLNTMDISGSCDYIAHQPYNEFNRVCRAAGFRPRRNFNWNGFWSNVKAELSSKETHLVISRRINPFSPSTSLIAFFSEQAIFPSNQLNIIVEPDIERAQAVCALLNSVLFLAQFFLLKEESTGRYIDIRFYDLYEMNLCPLDSTISPLVKVFKEYDDIEFPPLRNQFDENFEERYQEFWEARRRQSQQQRLWTILDQPIQPSSVRISFDLAICQALNIPISRDELIQLYNCFVNEMITIRGLRRD